MTEIRKLSKYIDSNLERFQRMGIKKAEIYLGVVTVGQLEDLKKVFYGYEIDCKALGYYRFRIKEE